MQSVKNIQNKEKHAVFCERRKFIPFKLWKLQFWPLNDQIAVSFVRAAGVLAKGRMFDIPAVKHIYLKFCW